MDNKFLVAGDLKEILLMEIRGVHIDIVDMRYKSRKMRYRATAEHFILSPPCQDVESQIDHSAKRIKGKADVGNFGARNMTLDSGKR